MWIDPPSRLLARSIILPWLFLVAAYLPFVVVGLQTPESHGSARIDYSAMNEYVAAHYGSLAGATPYFPADSILEDVFNGRQGIWLRSGVAKEASLASCGFELVSAPTRVQNWHNKDELRTVYLPELRTILEQELGGADNILHMEFFHPMLRGEELGMQPSTAQTLPTSPTAAVAHIDNDIGAFEPERVVSLVETNCITYEHQEDFPRQALLDRIQAGHRFLVVNCWRNTGTDPIQRAPLGIYATHYKQANTCFPSAEPDLEHSRWYVFPEMTIHECLLFKQYDRDVRYASDLWHCALQSLSLEGAPLRKSLDVRAFIVLKERVLPEHDRYSEDRIRPILTFEESEEFCDAQGEARKPTGSSYIGK